jgi:hypothetical protein
VQETASKTFRLDGIKCLTCRKYYRLCDSWKQEIGLNKSRAWAQSSRQTFETPPWVHYCRGSRAQPKSQPYVRWTACCDRRNRATILLLRSDVRFSSLMSQGLPMAREERCPKNPSMLKVYCSHCQGTELGTEANPRFSIRQSYFDDFPVVEVLKNGGPVHVYDSSFRFGIRKALMLVTCVDVLREFWQSTASTTRRSKRFFATRTSA